MTQRGGERKMSEDTFTVKAFRPEIIDAGTYPATVAAMKKRPGSYGEDYVLWIFQPDGFSEDAQPAGNTSLGDGLKTKGMEWARRILGKSTATDMKWGHELKEKRPVVDWGPDILVGKPCRIVVEKNWDEDEERYRNHVVNVLPPTETKIEQADTEASLEAESFEDIPF
jgi:hypothetical protein